MSDDSDYDPEKIRKNKHKLLQREYRAKKTGKRSKTFSPIKRRKKEKNVLSNERSTEDDVTHRLGTLRYPNTDDPPYDSKNERRRSKSESNKKRRQAGKVNDHSAERKRSLRETRHIESITPSENGFSFRDPEIWFPAYLGFMIEECPYCAALHFLGKHICCIKGKVFIPPMAKLPEPLQSLIHGPPNTLSRHFLNEINTYNANFSFASTQYSRQPVGRFGVPALRARGAVNHFSSAVEPHLNREPVFGNVYVYQGSEAVDKRMKSQFALTFNKELVEQIQQMLEQLNPLADMYYTMGKKIEMVRKSGGKIDRLRLKIVDPSKVNPHQLQAHEGVYGKPASYKNYVALFYTSSIEQKVTLPGYIVYPKHAFHISRPIFPWSDLINPLCYPLLFPRGERGFSMKKYPFCTDRLNSKDRLKQYAALHRDEAVLWDTPIQPFKHVSRADSNLMDSGSESSDDDENLNDENLKEDVYNAQAHHVEEVEEEEEDTVVAFEERGGVMYPARVRQLTGHVPQQQQDDLMDEIENEDNEEAEFSEDLDIVYDVAEKGTDEGNRHVFKERNQNGDNRATDFPEENLDIVDDVDEEGTGEENRHASKERNSLDVTHRVYASFRDYIVYQMQQRNDFKNRFTASRNLGQLYLIDNCTRLFKSRSDFIQQHHTEFMSSNRKKFLEAYQRRIAKSGRQIGCITAIPSSIAGSPRYLQKKYEDVVALANRYGAPDLFITMTANVNWQEIKNSIPHGSTWADYPFIVNEVFWKKFEKFKEVVFGVPFEERLSDRHPGLFGKVRWWSYAVEFQARGPPHIHAIVSLVDHVRTSADVNKICQAVIPPEPLPSEKNYEQKKRLRKLVCDLMIHRPCEHDPEAYCQQNKKQHWKTCKKHFPKPFSNETHFGDLTYPELKRPDNGSYVLVNSIGSRSKFIKATNQYVVPYNTQLTTMFESHINVEVISALRSVKYIFKYEFKGYDRTLVETITSTSNQVGAGNMTIDGHIMYPKSLPLTKEIIEVATELYYIFPNGAHVLVYDETHFVEDLRSTTSCEAAWEFAGYPRTDCSHTVVTVFVHQPHQEPITFPVHGEEEEHERLQTNEVTSRLKSWFKLNESQDLHAQTLVFPEIPKSYRYVKDHWVRRKIKLHNLIGRTKAVNPRNKELYAIYLLSSNRVNITSFPSLRTVNGIIFTSFVEAAKELGLMNDRREWDLALAEAAHDKMPIHLRRLFASILLFCTPENPLELWEHHKEDFYEKQDYWTEVKKQAHALHHIQSILLYHGSSLQQQNLPAVMEDDLPARHELCNDGNSRAISPTKSEQLATSMYQNMNREQKVVFDTIANSVLNNRRKSFFINGSGGCGKTYVYNALCHKLSVNHRVLCVAHTGIAAILLPGGRTSHRTFQIPLTTEDGMHCRVNQEDEIANELRAVDVVLWDEATMSDRRILEAVHLLMCSLHPNDSTSLFGGVPFVFGGDWKQTLPILKEVRGAGILQYTMLRSELWNNIKVLQLTKNVRALSDLEYANFLMDVGFGRNENRSAAEEEQKIQLPKRMLVKTEKEVIDFVFGNGQILNTTTNAAILTADNASSMAINDQILNLLPGKPTEYKSIDTFDENSGFPMLNPDVYNQLTPKGMPPHKLNLKIGAVIMLLRNINTELSLCNGTRLKILKLGKRVLTCKPILKKLNSPEIVYLPRLLLFASIQATSRELAFHRFQFPVRLSYAMTIHKYQGQTLSKVGIILRTPVFSHGQLYVALSRVRSINDIKIFNISSMNSEVINVVYKSIFSLI